MQTMKRHARRGRPSPPASVTSADGVRPAEPAVHRRHTAHAGPRAPRVRRTTSPAAEEQVHVPSHGTLAWVAVTLPHLQRWSRPSATTLWVSLDARGGLEPLALSMPCDPETDPADPPTESLGAVHTAVLMVHGFELSQRSSVARGHKE